MKKVILTLTLASVLSPLASAQAATGQEALAVPEGALTFEWNFVTSAYYSPQEGQSFYLTGNVESEKKLNGNGTNGADGTPVFYGFLAAPSNVPFGTKIYIPGIGLGEVHDRGGAIKNSRIDIWMGKGEAGLQRALTWGKREKACTVYLPGAEIPEAIANKNFADSFLFQEVALSESHIASLQGKGSAPSSLSKGDVSEAVRELQENLQALGFLEEFDTTTYFGSQTESAVLAFQIEHEIVASAEDAGAGVFGPQTQAKMNEILGGEVVAANEAENVISSEATFEFGESFTLGSQGEGVSELQTALRELGYFEGEATGYFGIVTAEAVFDFQKDKGLLTNKDELGAGIFGPRTRTSLQAALENEEGKVVQGEDEIVLGEAFAEVAS